MATKKLIPLSHLVKAAGLSQVQTLDLLKKQGLSPQKEVRTARMTYRLYDQATLAAVQKWREQREVEMGRRDPPVTETQTAADVPAPTAVPLVDVLASVAAQQSRQGQASAAHATLVNAALARLEVSLGNLQKTVDDLGQLVLNVLTQPTTPGVLDQAVGGGADDRPRVS